MGLRRCDFQVGMGLRSLKETKTWKEIMFTWSLNLLLGYEEWISPGNSSGILIDRYPKEEHIIHFQVSTKIYFRPIHNRFLGYSS
jgi:hypothetical protein